MKGVGMKAYYLEFLTKMQTKIVQNHRQKLTKRTLFIR